MNPVVAPEAPERVSESTEVDIQDYLNLLRTTDVGQCNEVFRKTEGGYDYYCAVGLISLLVGGGRTDPTAFGPTAFGLGDVLTEYEGAYIAYRFPRASGINCRFQMLTYLNDTEKLTFPEIADFIEEMGWDIA